MGCGTLIPSLFISVQIMSTRCQRIIFYSKVEELILENGDKVQKIICPQTNAHAYEVHLPDTTVEWVPLSAHDGIYRSMATGREPHLTISR